MQEPHKAITAFVLAGGKSTRMGSDKAFVVLDGKTLLERALEATRAVTDQVLIVGLRSKFLMYAPVVEDIFPERGPLAGIHAALMHTATDLNLVLAVDLPFMQPSFLTYLCDRAAETQAAVVIPRAAGGWQPLCAVYRQQFRDAAGKALAAGQNKIDSLFANLRVSPVQESEIAQAGFSLGIFRNINTSEELAAEGGRIT